ncbi:hypothetical protein MVEN_01649000 [Mycena venus]|uniref:Uncharacterized protein n=1 Tax=Mycena venus TaxID=2733690 RepID=A0A8H6XQZ3_9AGAR|nr:hypothetical protein MVEN_01649000 [Mycena venus]
MICPVYTRDSLSPTLNPTCTTPEDHSAFTSSTFTYLASPVAQALGLESPVRDSPLAQAALGVASPASPTTGSAAVMPTVTPPPPTVAPPEPPLPRIRLNTLSPSSSPPSAFNICFVSGAFLPYSFLHKPFAVAAPPTPTPAETPHPRGHRVDDQLNLGPWLLPPASHSPSSVPMHMGSMAAVMPQSPTLLDGISPLPVRLCSNDGLVIQIYAYAPAEPPGVRTPIKESVNRRKCTGCAKENTEHPPEIPDTKLGSERKRVHTGGCYLHNMDSGGECLS